MKKWMKVVLIGTGVFAVAAGIAAIVCIAHYVGFPEPAGSKKTGYRTEKPMQNWLFTRGNPMFSPENTRCWQRRKFTIFLRKSHHETYCM